MNPDLTTGDIYPGIGIGDFHLGMPLSELRACLAEDILSEVVRDGTVVIRTPALVFRVNQNTAQICQITARMPFEGRIPEMVGLGDTIALVREHLGPIRPHRHECLYFLECHQGIAFEIAEVPWGTETALALEVSSRRAAEGEIQSTSFSAREALFLQNGVLNQREVEAIYRARQILLHESPPCCGSPADGCEAVSLARLDAILNTAPIQAIHVFPSRATASWCPSASICKTQS